MEPFLEPPIAELPPLVPSGTKRPTSRDLKKLKHMKKKLDELDGKIRHSRKKHDG